MYDGTNKIITYCEKLLTDNQMNKLLIKISMNEKFDISQLGFSKIVEISHGSARDAIQHLQSISSVDLNDQIEALAEFSDVTEDVRLLCRNLLNKKDLKTLCENIKNIKEEPEAVRRMVLGYMNVVFLNSQDMQALKIIKYFKDNYYDSSKSGLMLSVASCVLSK